MPPADVVAYFNKHTPIPPQGEVNLFHYAKIGGLGWVGMYFCGWLDSKTVAFGPKYHWGIYALVCDNKGKPLAAEINLHMSNGANQYWPLQHGLREAGVASLHWVGDTGNTPWALAGCWAEVDGVRATIKHGSKFDTAKHAFGTEGKTFPNLPWIHLLPKNPPSFFRPTPSVGLTGAKRKKALAIAEDGVAHWRDETGWFRLGQDPAHQGDYEPENPVYFTAWFFYLCWRLGLMGAPSVRRAWDELPRMLSRIRLEPGVFRRRPELKDRHFSKDEQAGLVMLDWISNGRLRLASELYDYGKRKGYPHAPSGAEGPETLFFFQNADWSAKGKHDRLVLRGTPPAPVSQLELVGEAARRPYFIGMLRVATGRKPSALQLNEFKLALDHTAKAGDVSDTSSRLLAHLRTRIWREGGDSARRAVQDFDGVVAGLFGGDDYVYRMMKVYYHHHNHPNVQLAKLLGTHCCER